MLPQLPLQQVPIVQAGVGWCYVPAGMRDAMKVGAVTPLVPRASAYHLAADAKLAGHLACTTPVASGLRIGSHTLNSPTQSLKCLT